ncbi:MAG: hypothetical protein WBP98_10600 [Candidatus Sulfotelmatobacter sp.]
MADVVVIALACHVHLDDDLDSEKEEGLVSCRFRFVLPSRRPSLLPLFKVAHYRYVFPHDFPSW